MFKNNYKKQKAFTLVELLVVIAIIGILATLAVVALQQARSRARDSKRIADIKQAQTALELFFNEQGRYPSIDEWNSGTLITSSGEMLMINIPTAPYPADGICDPSQNTFYYQVDDDYSTYSISFCLGNDISSLEEGPKCATPGGILNYDCSGGESGSGEEPTSNICYPDCQPGYICQSGSCVVDTFECGQTVSYNDHTYPTVAIGDQCWFKENLITDKFKNGDSIPKVTGTWGSTISSWISYHSNSSYYPAYDFLSTYGNLYGHVYSSHTITDPRGVCPDGWMVSTRDDFISLINNIGAYNIYNLRSCRQVNSPLGGECTTSEHPYWASDTVYGTDDLGFSLLPGGHKYSTQWPYFGTGFYLWTSTASETSPNLYYIYNTGGSIIATSSTVPIDSIYGRYVRCIKKTDLAPKTIPSVITGAVNNVSATRAFSGGTISGDSGSIVHSGGVVWSENNNPLIGDNNSKFLHTTLSSNTFVSDVFYGLQPGKTYYIRAYAVNEVGVGYGNVLSFTTPDPCLGLNSVSYNGHTYPTVAIGDQCWFKENLITDKFKNGDSIPRVTGSWTGANYPLYDFLSTYGNLYGYVYSSHTIIDPRGVCPEGWMVPTRDDFISLINNIGAYNVYNLRSCRQTNSPLGGECTTSEHPYWASDTVYGTDDLGFSLLPGGHKYSTQWPYFGTGFYLWTRTVDDLGTNLYYIYNNGGTGISTASTVPIDSIYGRYIRCIKE